MPVALLLFLSAGAAKASPKVLGPWVADDGTQIRIARCAAGLCATIASGRFKGENVAAVSGAPPEFKGRVRDPRNDTSYDGALRLNGARLELRGCLAKVFCRTVQSWRRP
ncbi:DUF2147 domain-containing protein [Jiella mangrovi]|uniref:DUF2147 domain-containing protein n=1 Tax=Jiella mangrovi TaxID=2821407 RepID=A0ABS4BHL9_9HYPH|nr:DUF2147 domain-containing protein [Jiella mangrovi]MBP0616248.1 DUF2147 domain-containing protein [Jiella mangrovi]